MTNEMKSVNLEEVSNIIMGQSPDSEYYNEEGYGYPFLQGCANFTSKYPRAGTFCSVPSKIAPKDSILISVRAPVGDLNLSDRDYCIGRGLASIIPINIDLNYLFYSISLNKRGFNRVSQGSTFDAINSQDLRKFKVLVPIDKRKEKGISNILLTIDRSIENTERLIDKYKSIKQGLMQDLFSRGIQSNGNLRPSYSERPELYKKTRLGYIPKEWDAIKLCDSEIAIIDGDRGVNYPKENELLNEGFCIFLSANNVTSKGFKFSNMKYITKEKNNLLGSGKLERYDIIITTRGTVGNIAFYNDEVPYEHIRINSGMIILRNKEKGMDNEFLYYLLRNYIFEREYRRIVSGSAQPQLPIKDLKHFLIIKPSAVEQKGISDKVRTIEDKIINEYVYLEKLIQIKQGLMHDLLTGKVIVKVEGDGDE